MSEVLREEETGAFGPLLASFLSEHKLQCMDVGAAGGVHPLWRPYSPFIHVDAFEPNEAACAAASAASEPHISWHPVALGARTGTQEFYLLNAPTGSSFYPPNDEVQQFFNDSHYRGINRVLQIETMTAADFIRAHRRPPPNLLKLDTQGSELDILRGLGEENWSEVLSIEIEVEFVELYKGQPLFNDVDAYLRSQGLVLFDLRTARGYCSAHDRSNWYLRNRLNFAVGRNDLSARLYAGDALYFRDFARMPPESKANLMKLIGSVLMYSYYDYALYLADIGERTGLLSRDEQVRVTEDIVGHAPRPEPWERADAVGDRARQVMAQHGLADLTYRAFWMTRAWPDQ